MKNIKWTNFNINSRKTTVFGNSLDEKLFIKIELKKNPKKNFDVDSEFDVIKFLNERNAVTAPRAHEKGVLVYSDLEKILEEEYLTRFQKDQEYQFMITDFIPHSENYNISDVMFSMIEQKNLGVFQGDIKPDNIRYDSKSCVCYIVDYDQAIFLNEEQKNSNAKQFFDFCSQYDKEKFGFGNWLRHFKNSSKSESFTQSAVDNLIIDGAFNMQWTNLVQKQNTTNTPDGLYHKFDHRDIVLNGRRGIDERADLLNSVNFKKGEKVLDVGCNFGLLSFYLADRGCIVTGFDIDSHVITLAKIIANILRKECSFEPIDIDKVQKLDKYDTIFLFSVLHHTVNQRENFVKINEACNRIIIEMRLKENGSQPIGVNNEWVNVASWNFQSVEHLVEVFENQIFTDFKFSENLGYADKGRMILEFVKK